jgi:ferric iron reductase protein FhuF
MTPASARPGGGFVADLANAMGGRLAHFAAGLVGPDECRVAVRAEYLLGDAMLHRLLEHAAQTASAPNPRAVVSKWALGYFETVLPPLLSAAILLDRMPRLRLDEVGFILAPGGQIAALQVFGDRRGSADDRLAALVDHLACFVELVAARGIVTARVLWSNAGHIFEAFLTMLESAAADRHQLEGARSLLARPVLFEQIRNPLFQPVHTVAGQRVRRVCCLRFLVPEWRICLICPLPGNSRARARMPEACAIPPVAPPRPSPAAAASRCAGPTPINRPSQCRSSARTPG